MAVFKLLKVVVAAVAICSVVAHPNLSEDELVQYHQNAKRHTEALARCLQSREMRTLNARLAEGRAATFHRLRKARGIDLEHKRASNKDALIKWMKSNHQHNGQSKDPQDIWHFHWEDQVHSLPAACALSPEADDGPFWIDRQPMIQDIRGGQPGLYVRLALHIVDVETCKPMWNARVDAWQANAIGHYSENDPEGFLRGWQPSSRFGTVEFDTIFPGHYYGRVNHVHVAVRPDNKQHMAHFGQIYFDEALREKIEAQGEYRKNTWELTKLLDDGLAPDSASDLYDPFVQWSWLTKDNFEDGLLAWIAVGVNNSNPDVKQPNKRGVLNEHISL